MLLRKSVQDGIIDHDDFLAIIKEKKDYDSQKKKNKLYFHDYKLAVEIDGNNHQNRNENYKW